MEPAKQDQLAEQLEAVLEASGVPKAELVFFLVSFTWGWARRIGWSTLELAGYVIQAFDTNEAELKRRGQQVPR